MNCAYCNLPLECDRCRVAFVVTDPEVYANLSRPEVPVLCPLCEQVLVCTRCKTPYDGRTQDEADLEA